jgi:hypothetical protein
MPAAVMPLAERSVSGGHRPGSAATFMIGSRVSTQAARGIDLILPKRLRPVAAPAAVSPFAHTPKNKNRGYTPTGDRARRGADFARKACSVCYQPIRPRDLGMSTITTPKLL